MSDMVRSATVAPPVTGLAGAVVAGAAFAFAFAFDDAAGLEPVVPELPEQAAAARPSAPAPTAMDIQDLTVNFPPE
jgi:hypothetical protein